MAEASTEVLEPTEVELKEAREMGWADKDKWRGKEEDWVDAKTFLEKGKQVLPIVAAHNKRLRGDLDTLGGELASVKAALDGANAAIEALQASHDEDTKAQVEAARAKLKTELAAASRDGDHEAVADLTDQMTRLNTADDKADKDEKGDKGNGKDRQEPQLHPEVVSWFTEHPDFAKDRRRIALARAIADEKRTAGDKRVGAAFLDEVAEEVEQVLGGAGGNNGASRVAGGNGGTSRSNAANGGGKSYADLPAEAKAACDKMAARLVGENRAHKTIDSWRKSYTQQYYKD